MSGQTSVSPRRLLAPRTARGWVPLTVSRLTFIALIAVFAIGSTVGVEVPMRVQAGVYLVGMVAMNLPHGGYEHVNNLRRRGLPFQLQYLAVYLAAIGAFVWVFFAAPVLGLTLACGVAVAKGGHGGLHVMDATYGTDHLETRLQRGLAAFVRGGVVMLVPLAFWPEVFHAYSSFMIGMFEPGALAAVAERFRALTGSGLFATMPYLVGGVYAAAATTHLGLGYVRADALGSWLLDAAETVLMTVYFAVVPVVLAVGVYFPLWYSTRQVARETAVEADGDPRPSSTRRGLLGFLDTDDPRLIALGAWGVLIVGSLATFGIAAAVYFLAPNPFGGAGPLVGGVAFWSVFVSIIALPHVVVGSWLDREGGIWYVP